VGEDRWRNLEVWQLADALALRIYQETRGFPKEELFGLTSQLRRAALSVPTNLVEGYSRKGDKELAHFVNIALGSLAETGYLMDFAHRLGYFAKDVHDSLAMEADLLGKKLWRFYEKVRG
jgi:four helix bundle protein